MVNQSQKRVRWQTGGAIFLLVLIALIYLAASPLFKGNPWVDSNAMLTIGQAWQRGVIPYKEIFEQRGPVMFFYYYLTNLISPYGYFGLFVIETLNLIGLWFWTKKLLALLNIKPAVQVWAALIVPVGLVANYSFEHGGSPEEFALFWLLGSFYFLAKFLQTKQLTPAAVIFVGFSAAAVFWIKYSLLGAWIGFVLIVLWQLIRQKRWVYLLKTVAYFLIGFGGLTLIIWAYFASVHAWNDLLHVYFTVNMSAYAASGEHHGLLVRVLGLIRPILVGFIVHPFLTVSFVAALVWAYLKQQRHLFWLTLITTAMAALLAYWSLLRYPYIFLIVVGPMLPVIAWALADLAQRFRVKSWWYLLYALVLLDLPNVGNIVTHTNVPVWSKQVYPAQAFGRYIDEHRQGKTATLVYANFIDMGVDRYTDINHRYYFFEQSNFTKKAFPAQHNYVDDLVKKQKPDYLVFDLNLTNLKQIDLNDHKAVNKKVDPAILDKYQVVAAGSTKTIGAVYVTGPRKIDQVQYVLLSRKEAHHAD
ncbi:hypothetical protein PUF88_01215 [Lactobacillaceae bacterium L1_55_11]|nr:hypothetical protein [Lactobacillaceae bacterium L1_55_11]